MVKDRDQPRVGSTPNLRYTLLDSQGNEVSVVDATSLSIVFVPPSGGTGSTGTPALISGEVAVVDFQTLPGTFNAAGLWVVAVKATFAGSLVYESTVDEITVRPSQF